MKRDFLWHAKCWTSVLLLSVVGAAQAESIFQGLKFDPYIGIEYQYSHIKETPPWSLILPSNLQNGAIFVGTKYHKNFGLEIGYYHTLHKVQESAFLSSFGVVQPGGGPGSTYVMGQMRNQGFSFEWDVYFPLDPNFNLMAVVGLVTMHPNIEFLTSGNTGLDAALRTVTGSNKTILRLGIGAEYIEKHWGARGKLLLDDTQKLYLNVSHVGNNFTYITSRAFKQTCTFTVGVFYRF